MATLLDYTQTEFPNHTVEVWQRDGWSMPVHRTVPPGSTDVEHVTPVRDAGDQSRDTGSTAGRSDRRADDMTLRDHTVVAHVIGSQAALDLMDRLRRAGWRDTTAVLVCPAPPSVVRHGGEDPESATDLPDRRVVGSAVLGAVVAALLGAAAGWILGDHLATGLISGGFSAILGAVVGAMLGGLGRHAGERAWSQPHAPGRTMGVVATFADDDHTAHEIVRVMETADPYDIRLVSASGSWRTPLG